VTHAISDAAALGPRIAALCQAVITGS